MRIGPERPVVVSQRVESHPSPGQPRPVQAAARPAADVEDVLAGVEAGLEPDQAGEEAFVVIGAERPLGRLPAPPVAELFASLAPPPVALAQAQRRSSTERTLSSSVWSGLSRRSSSFSTV